MEKIDVLSRDEFVGYLIQLTENISKNKVSTSFAVNGKWGSGKSFVFDMYEEKLKEIQSEETKTNKYLIIRYNCWKYDYYEEPLVAIVAAMLDVIEQETKIFPGEQGEKVKGVLKAVGATLLSISTNALKTATGVELKEPFAIIKSIKSGIASGKEQYEQMQKYDVYFAFKQALQTLQEVINTLGEQYTIVFLIDEMDRCLPEYAIKVLERLHHLNEDTKNVISIIAIDKSQLKSSIQHIFGFEDADEYLKKFIQFTIPLNAGNVSEKIIDKYSSYISLFDKEIFPFEDSIEEFMQAVFLGIEVRTQEQLMHKVELAHNLLYSDKKDYSFMCMEVLLAVMICAYDDESCFVEKSVASDYKNMFDTYPKNIRPAFIDLFVAKFDEINFRRERDFADEPYKYILPEKPNLYGSILFTWYWMHKRSSDKVFQYIVGTKYDEIAQNHEILKKFAEVIKLIK